MKVQHTKGAWANRQLANKRKMDDGPVRIKDGITVKVKKGDKRAVAWVALLKSPKRKIKTPNRV